MCHFRGITEEINVISLGQFSFTLRGFHCCRRRSPATHEAILRVEITSGAGCFRGSDPYGISEAAHWPTYRLQSVPIEI